MGGGEGDFVEELFVGDATGDHLVDDAPVGQAADIAVVDEHIGLKFAAADGALIDILVGIVAIDGEKVHSALVTILNCILQQTTLAATPQNQAMTIVLKLLQSCDSERDFLADRWIFVFHYRSIKIYGYNHFND